jgi:uncharacterized membrane protein
MTDEAEVVPAVPRSELVALCHVMYALHAFSAITGMLTPVLVVTAFLTGWPSLLAVLINYLKRESVRGTVLDSHFSWQLRTFWWAVLWVLVAWLFFVTLVGIPIAIGMWILVGLWVLYRLLRGWLALLELKPLPRD